MKRILFICVENSCRSQIAEAFVRIHGAGRAEAYSAGSCPAGQVNQKALEVMDERGYDLRRHHSKSVGELPDREFDSAVTMGCGDRCPQVRVRERHEWEIPDPGALPLDEFRALCDLIEEKVQGLLLRLS
ncbi:MAG: arsenate reductase ArsC [Thermodesulfobacteriota bacterium]